MRPVAEMSPSQIELTDACVRRCSNCTRACGHREPFFMTEEVFTRAVASLVEYAKQPRALIGFFGGEPLLHPQFVRFCEIALSLVPRTKLILSSTFPDGPKYRGYREVICRTFGSVYLNDHSRNDILHAPILMAAEDYFKKACPKCKGSGKFSPSVPCAECKGTGQVTDEAELFAATERCWVSESWSSSINPKGAWFCEVAGSLSILFDGPKGWDVDGDWWKKTTKDYTSQREWACRKCGAALPIKRERTSQDYTDDVSVSSMERLQHIRSRKIGKGEVECKPQFEFDPELVKSGCYPNQTYKEFEYREKVAAKYGIVLTMNPLGYPEPHMEEDMPQLRKKAAAPSLFKIFQEESLQVGCR